MFDLEKYILDFFKLPKPTASKLWASEFDKMSVHTRGLVPKEIIDKRRPFEPEEIKDFRLENYEAITKDAIDRAITNLQRLFTKSAVDYDYPDELRDYLNLNEFEGLKFWQYIQGEPIRRMIEDPNGCLIWWPVGEGTVKSNEKVRVQPHLVLSKNINHFTTDVFSWLSNEKSEVTTPKGREYIGDVYYIVTQEAFIKLVQVGKHSDKKFEQEIQYTHNLGFLPVIVLGGEKTGELNQKTNQSLTYYQSFFSAYTPWANEAIRQFSDHQGTMTTCAFPMREIEQIDCPSGCTNGKIWSVEDGKEKEKIECETCNGKGFMLPSSPYGMLIRPKKNLRPGETEKSSRPMMDYISPDVNVIKYQGEYWQQLLHKAEKSLNLLFIDEVQSGIAKSIDREDKDSMLDRIGSNFCLNVIANSLIIMNGLRDINSSRDDVKVSLPDTFKVKSENELMTELNELVEKDAPQYLISTVTEEVVRRKYGQNKRLQMISRVLSLIDPYFSYGPAKKQSLLAQGAMSEKAYYFSVHAEIIIKRMIEDESSDFDSTEIEKIKDAIHAEIQPLLSTFVDDRGLPVS